MSLNFTIEELKIILSTNIDKDDKNITFTSGMLHHPELKIVNLSLNQYPYFTSDIKYPYSKLHSLNYKERVEFFFNKIKFREGIMSYYTKGNFLDKTDILDDEKEKKYYEDRDKNIENNIMITLDLLFPTKYPVINDIQTSFDILFENSKLKYMIINPLKKNFFSYLRLDGDIYTTKNIIWINDILNHPKYKMLIEKYHDFWLSTSKEKKTQLKAIEKSYELIKNELKMLYEKTIQKLKITKKGLDNNSIENYPYIFELNLLTGNGTIDEIEKNIKAINNGNINVHKNDWLNKIRDFDNLFDIEKYVRLKNIITILKEKKILNIEVNDDNSEKNYNILEIKNKIDMNNFLNLVDYYESLNNIFLSKRNDKDNKSLLKNNNYNEYEKIHSNYKRPIRESTNIELQKIINGDNDKDVKEYYNFLNFIYKRYYNFIKTNNIKTLENYKKYMNVGISIVNDNRNEKIKEIYVYADFIKGELDEINIKKINCPYLNSFLGNEVEKTIKLRAQNKETKNDYWNINKNRRIISLDDLIKKENPIIEENTEEEEEDSEEDFENQSPNQSPNHPPNQPPNQPPNHPPNQPEGFFQKLFNGFNPKKEQKNNVKIEKKKGINSNNELNINFRNLILSNNIEIDKKINNIIFNNDFKDILNKETVTLNKENLLFFLNKNNSKLISLIEEWNKDNKMQNKQLINNLLALQSKTEGEIKIKKEELIEIEKKRDFLELNVIKYKIELLELYILLINTIYNSEKKKEQILKSTKGGKYSKKIKKRKKIFTKKNKSKVRK
jgi:hypothetical protein